MVRVFCLLFFKLNTLSGTRGVYMVGCISWTGCNTYSGRPISCRFINELIKIAEEYIGIYDIRFSFIFNLNRHQARPHVCVFQLDWGARNSRVLSVKVRPGRARDVWRVREKKKRMKEFLDSWGVWAAPLKQPTQEGRFTHARNEQMHRHTLSQSFERVAHVKRKDAGAPLLRRRFGAGHAESKIVPEP